MSSLNEDQRLDVFLSFPQVKQIASLSRSTIDRKMKAGEFPLSVRTAKNRVAWRESEVLAWFTCPNAWGKGL